MALSWGHALQAMVYATTADHEFHRLTLAQLVGGLSSISNEISGQELVRELAVRLGAEYRFLHAPATLESTTSRHALMAEPSIVPALDDAGRADIAFVGIGTPTHGSSAAILDSLNLDAGSHGRLLGRRPGGRRRGPLLQRAGRPIRGEVDDRVLGIDPRRPARDPQRRRGRLRPRQDARRPRRTPRSHHRLPRLRRGPRPQRAQRCAGPAPQKGHPHEPRIRHPRRRRRRLAGPDLLHLPTVAGVQRRRPPTAHLRHGQRRCGRQPLQRPPVVRRHRGRRARHGPRRDHAQRLHHVRPGQDPDRAVRRQGLRAARRPRPPPGLAVRSARPPARRPSCTAEQTRRFGPACSTTPLPAPGWSPGPAGGTRHRADRFRR